MTIESTLQNRHPRALAHAPEARQTSVRRVRDILRASISSGMFFNRDSLGEDTLMRELDASRNSVREALRMLSDEGLVERRRHSGTSVSGAVVRVPLGDDLPHRSGEMRFRWLDERRVPTNDYIARQLETEADEVTMIDHLFVLAGQTVGIRALYVATDVEIPRPEAALHREESFLLAFGRPLGRTRTTVEACAADLKTARTLGLEAGGVVIVRQQTLFDDLGTPRVLEFAHFRADKVSLTEEV